MMIGIAISPCVSNTQAQSAATITSDTTLYTADSDVITADNGPTTSTFTMTQLVDRRIYQRLATTGGDANKGYGSISVAISAADHLVTVEYRLRNADTGAIAKDWTSAAYNVSAGSRIIVCENVPADAVWYHVDLRSGSSLNLGASRVGMGRVIAMAGQSLAVRSFVCLSGQTDTMASLGVSISPYCSVYGTYLTLGERDYTTPTWQYPDDNGDYDAAFTGEFLRREVEASGVVCALIGHSAGSTSISLYVPNGSENPALTSVLAAGPFETFIWFQGHSDSRAGMAESTYSAYLDILYAYVITKNAFATFNTLVCTIPNITSTAWGTVDQIAAIRAAAANWCTLHGHIYSQPMDLELMADGVHQSQLGSVTEAIYFSTALH